MERKRREREAALVGTGCLIAGAAMILAGIMRAEPDVVLMKAITICMECIGIG